MRVPSSTPAGNLDRQLAALERAAFAVAGGAWIGDRLGRCPGRSGSRARRRRSPAARGPCRRRRRSGRSRGRLSPLRSASVARLASGQRFDGDGLFGAGEGFFERQFQVVAQVGAARGVGALAARVHELAEDIDENVGERPKPCDPPPNGCPAAAAVLEGGLAEAVVGGALLRILQDLIGLADRLEMRFLVGAAAMAVGMAFHRDLAIRRLDRRRVGAAIDAEQAVIISVRHDAPRNPSPQPKPGRRSHAV